MEKTENRTHGQSKELAYSVETMISDQQRDTISLINYVFLCGIISAFGIVTNIINLLIFYIQGLNSTTNISFFALAVSDICSLLIQQLFNIYVNPLFEHLHLPIVYTDVQHLTSCVPRALFSRITCLITVYKTGERCLCVVFPLHIKQMITPRRTKIIIACIYVLTMVSVVPLYTVHHLEWKFNPETNRTLLGMLSDDEDQTEVTIVFFFHAFSGLLSFLAVVVLTSILIGKLREKCAWRLTANLQHDNSGAMYKRDKITMAMVVVVSSILIVCYIPSTALALVTVWEPEFSVEGRYYNYFYVLWSFAFVLENVNSSVNILLYLKMSSKYRQTFFDLLRKIIKAISN